jgi:putative Holliday junction resolvase
MKAMGVDWGERRIGLALSDETGTLATPLTTLLRRPGKRPPIVRIERLAREHAVQAVVVGLPLELSGAESGWTREVRTIAEQIGSRLDLPVHLIDERLSSVRAERAVRSSGRPRSEREDKDRMDAAAAAVLLQDWLDRRGREVSEGVE